MARTLIGNIKGKDGRGITSINKTGTTGSVDTYTITYTDSTTSTFTVNNSDAVALQRQIVPSAAVESSATASQAYAAGDYVVVNGVMRKVKSSIANGNAISDSNSTATTVTRELSTLSDSVSSVIKTATSGSSKKLKLTFESANHSSALVFIDNNGNPSLVMLNCYDRKKTLLAGFDIQASFTSNKSVTISTEQWSNAVIVSTSECSVTSI